MINSDRALAYGGITGFRVPVHGKFSIGVEYSFIGYDIDDPDFFSGLTGRIYYKF